MGSHLTRDHVLQLRDAFWTTECLSVPIMKTPLLQAPLEMYQVWMVQVFLYSILAGFLHTASCVLPKPYILTDIGKGGIRGTLMTLYWLFTKDYWYLSIIHGQKPSPFSLLPDKMNNYNTKWNSLQPVQSVRTFYSCSNDVMHKNMTLETWLLGNIYNGKLVKNRPRQPWSWNSSAFRGMSIIKVPCIGNFACSRDADWYLTD